MPLTTAGRNHMVGLNMGEALTPFNNANAHIGVGNGVTVFSAADTDLTGASKARKAMDATFPTRAANVVTYRSTFATADANFAWDEAGSMNAATAGVMQTRVVSALGTKTSSATWQMTLTVTFS